MTNLRGYEIKVDRVGIGGDPLNERASAIFRAIPVVGPIHEIHLDAWADGELQLSVWVNEDAAEALWEGKIIIDGANVRIETREARPNGSYTNLTVPPPSAVVRRASPAWVGNRAKHAHTSGPLPDFEPTDAEIADLTTRLSAEVFPFDLLPLAPKPDPLAEFRTLEPGAPLYDRASNRQIGTFEEVSGDCVRLRSNVTGHTVISSGRAITRHERPVYEEVTPGDCRP